jgi:hypothetical protein
MSHTRCLLALQIVLSAAALAGAAETQPAASRPGSLRITVRDATDLPIAGAAIAVIASDGGTSKAITDAAGQGTVERLAPGSYTAVIESRGFERLEVLNLTVRSGARTSRNVVLQIAGIAEQVDVAPAEEDRQITDAFTTQLTPEAIAALPEDPDELMELLQQLAGSDAEIRVDGFNGGQLAPGAQLQEVRIRWDAGADSAGGGPRVEVRTRPGGDRWRTNGNVSLRDEQLNARNAFSGERPFGQTRQWGWTVSGPLLRNRTGFSFSIDGSESLEQQAVRAAAPGGIFSTLVSQPSDRLGFSSRIDHALNAGHTIRADVRHASNKARNQGIGEFDLPERTYTRDRSNGELRLTQQITLQRRLLNELRFRFRWDSTESSSASDATTIRVLDAFVSGGAQIYGGRRSRELEIEDELEFTVRDQHQIEAGFTVTGNRYRGDERRNENGTFTFASLDTFEAGRPTTFAQRVGDPTYAYSMYRFGWHVQDNYRVRRSLMLNLGLRHDLQTHLRDWANFTPRVGINWTPFPGRRTTVRASYNTFSRFFEASLYEQTLRVNGLQQRDLVISNPGYPDPFSSGVLEAGRLPGIIRARSDLIMPSTRRVQLGIDQRLAAWARLRGTYSRQTGHNLFRSRDVNAPVNGIRPDPTARNVTQIESTGRSRNQSFEMELSLSYQPRRFNGNVRYTLGEAFNETDDPLTLPPDSFDLSDEWGPSRQDVRHRLNVSVNSDLWAGFRVNANLRTQSAAPYTITTGLDTNGDGVNNERPEGVGRNAVRSASSNNLDVTLTWGLGVGQRGQVESPRGEQSAQRGGGRGGDRPRRGNEIFRFEVYARATNVLNAVNPQNFSGVITSPFFGRPTSASAARRVVLGTRISF